MPIMYYKTPVGIAQITEDDGFISRVHIMDSEQEVTEAQTALLKETAKTIRRVFCRHT
jgi:methylated-DNA-[protein]-cysteine S-methyltransferase